MGAPKSFSETFKVGMHLEINGWICFKLGIMIDTAELHILIPVQNTLDLDSRSQGCKKAKTSAPVF